MTPQTPGMGSENRRHQEFEGAGVVSITDSQNGLLGEADKTTWCCLLKCRPPTKSASLWALADNLHLNQLPQIILTHTNVRNHCSYSLESWEPGVPLVNSSLLTFLCLQGGKGSLPLNNQDLSCSEHFSVKISPAYYVIYSISQT